MPPATPATATATAAAPAALAPRVRAVVAAAFGVPVASVTRETGSHDLARWDSMNHLHLLVALEAEFGVAFEPERAIELTTVGAIEQAIAELVAASAGAGDGAGTGADTGTGTGTGTGAAR